MNEKNFSRISQDPSSSMSYRAKGQSGVTFPRERTAVLVIDPVNDFLSEGGAAWDLTKATVKMHGVVKNLKRLIEGARQRRVPVLFGPMAFTEEDYREKELHRLSGISRIMYERKMFLAGSWGADFHPELRPQDGDIILQPHKVTDVMQTDLPEHLKKLGTTHLVIAGMTANLCCESTGRHAAEMGYDVTYLSDAMGSENVPTYEAAVHLNFPLIGNAVMKVEEFLAAVDAPSAALVRIQAGDRVRGSDHGKIGKVKKVVEATDECEGYLLVPRGLFFKKHTFIPLDAVVRRVGKTVFINVPKLVIYKMPWKEPPSRQEQLKKHGPRAEEVENLYGSQSPSVREKRAS